MVFFTIQKQGQREEVVRETENLSVLGLKRRGNSIYREIRGRIKRKHNRINTSRAGQMVQSNIYNSKAPLEMEENSGCECTEQGNTNDSFQDECNRSSERFYKERRLDNQSRSKISLSPSNNISTTQTIPSIRINGKVYQYGATPFGTLHSPFFVAQALVMVLTKIRRESDIRILNYVDDLLLLHRTMRDFENKHKQQQEFWKNFDGEQPKRNVKQNQNNRFTSQNELET
ncbi:MAG: hypothetical protein EZS28_015076 [Streblomastix strix]|uniref:Reverse transcriptase domain-containing protein n=1 Tax=Streblomastix strix TaxID=222440 RepID=A0A5J4W4E9_9EUKA|nr:MAG: hypothetical protein EZS28_015076 [Streblomastix strix]